MEKTENYGYTADPAYIFSYRTNVLLFLDASSHLYMRVCPSVRPSIRPSVGGSVTLSSKTREINIFEQNIVTGGMLGPLDASLRRYTSPVHQSVCQTSVNINFNKSKRE